MARIGRSWQMDEMIWRSLPKQIADRIGERKYETDGIGRSDSVVLLFDDMVLKIEKSGDLADNEHRMMTWLAGKLPVPRVLAFARANGYHYLLMTRLDGVMAFDASLTDKKAVAKTLAEGLLSFWALDISDCPVQNSLDDKLKRAKERLDAGLLTHQPDGTEACLGFTTLEALYAYLDDNRPEEELVFSHGDYCLPNIFLKNGGLVGVLDLGRAGISDKWSDITDCLWSMTYNFRELGGMSDEALAECKAVFFSTLGLGEDAKTIKYYDLLNEFFG